MFMSIQFFKYMYNEKENSFITGQAIMLLGGGGGYLEEKKIV